MGLVREALGAPPFPLAEVDRDGESGGTRGDMDGCATCEIEPAGDEDPPFGVPGPACDGVVDDRRPDEDEYEEGAESGTFCNGANSEDGAVRDRGRYENSMSCFSEIFSGNRYVRDGREHELVYRVYNGRNARRPNTGLPEDALHAKVICTIQKLVK